jgi:hypothetical protein
VAGQQHGEGELRDDSVSASRRGLTLKHYDQVAHLLPSALLELVRGVVVSVNRCRSTVRFVVNLTHKVAAAHASTARM